MTELNNFEVLTDKVTKLANSYKETRKTNEALLDTVERLNSKIAFLEEKVADYETDKRNIKLNVEGIIEKIEELEFGE